MGRESADTYRFGICFNDITYFRGSNEQCIAFRAAAAHRRMSNTHIAYTILFKLLLLLADACYSLTPNPLAVQRRCNGVHYPSLLAQISSVKRAVFNV